MRLNTKLKHPRNQITEIIRNMTAKPTRITRPTVFCFTLMIGISCLGSPEQIHETQANVIIEIPFRAQETHDDPFYQVNLDVVFTEPGGTQKNIPAFWVGGDRWKVRYSSSVIGSHRYRTQCSDTKDKGLHGIEGQVEIGPYTGQN